jgi:ATP-dependent helicase/nuclease subunit B
MTLRIYNIPSTANFLVELARAVLRGGLPVDGRPPPKADDLARWTILVPTRRSARALEQVFLDLSPGKALLLPNIRPIGDVDEDTLDIFEPRAEPGEAAVPAALSPMGREFLLVDLIERWAKAMPTERLAREISASPIQALSLARSLAHLIDGFESRDKDFDRLPKAYDVPELPEHREAILEFLKIVMRDYPERLFELKMLGSISRRSKLIIREASRLKALNPADPVIAAGSTGSIAATAELLSVIAGLDNGAVVLPGLDLGMDEASWAALLDPKNVQAPGHAQFGLCMLLNTLGISRADIEELPGLQLSQTARCRDWLAGETMRPSPTTDAWHLAILPNFARISQGIGNVEFIEAESRREEAAQIALCIREALEDAEKTVALVTPDRELALQVRTELARWAIAADDSAGTSLARTSPGSLFQLLLDLVRKPQDALNWAALIHHPLTQLSLDGKEAKKLAALFDMAILRYGQWQGDLNGLPAFCEAVRQKAAADQHLHPSLACLNEDNWIALQNAAGEFCKRMAVLNEVLAEDGIMPLARAVAIFVETYDRLVAPHDPWLGEAGEKLCATLISIREESYLFPPVSLARAAETLIDLIRRARVRYPAEGGARFAILGVLEARLIRANLMILGGLNETIWPAQPDPGPWLNRPMYAGLELESPESSIGLAAHDFAQGFGAEHVVLTWSKRLGDAPATPSRWILRLRMLLETAGISMASNPRWRAWSRSMDEIDQVKPWPRPEPKPKVRLPRLSVSQVETLYRDPYAIYARNLMRLEPLPRFAARADARQRGTIIHEALAQFAKRYPRRFPDNAVAELLGIGREIFGPSLGDPDIAAFWWPRFCRMAEWFAETDRILRAESEAFFCERDGRLEFPVEGEAFVLTGRADRIDVLKGRRLRIIDYKTGRSPTATQVEQGYAPQLTLEAVMAKAGVFHDVPAAKTSSLVYMKLSGGDPAGEQINVGGSDCMALASEHLRILKSKLASFATGMETYLPRRNLFSEDDVSDYDHLSRRGEWERG